MEVDLGVDLGVDVGDGLARLDERGPDGEATEARASATLTCERLSNAYERLTKRAGRSKWSARAREGGR